MTVVPRLLAGARPRPAGPLSASLTFAWRTVLKIRRVPEQMLDVIGIPILFTLMFTYLFGGALAGSTGDYLQFLLPGTMVMSVVIVTMYTGVGLNADIESGAFDRFRSLPVWRPGPLAGAVLADLVRYALAAALVVGLGLAMGFRPAGGAAGVLEAAALVCLFATAVGWIFTSLALVVRTPAAVTSVGMLVIFPLTFASNVFVDPQTMPGWLRAFVDANPVSHLVTAARGLMAGAPDGSEIGWVLVAFAAVTAVFAPLAIRLYAKER